MNSCFEERELWGVALESNFGKQLLETTFGGSCSSLGEQLFGAAFDNNFGNGFGGTALWSRFGEQLRGAGAILHDSYELQFEWGVALGGSFRAQLWGAAFGSNFGEQLSGTALENSFGEPLGKTGLMHSRFGATALQRCFGEQLWEAASGNRFGEQLWQAFWNNFEEQLL